LIVTDLLHHATAFERVKKAEYHPLIEPGADSDIAEAESLAGRLENSENLGSMNEALNQIRVASTIRGAHNLRERYHIVMLVVDSLRYAGRNRAAKKPGGGAAPANDLNRPVDVRCVWYSRFRSAERSIGFTGHVVRQVAGAYP
jgi:hypothetical protein